MEPQLACQVKSKWLHELRKGIGNGKRNRKEINHGGLDHLEQNQIHMRKKWP